MPSVVFVLTRWRFPFLFLQVIHRPTTTTSICTNAVVGVGYSSSNGSCSYLDNHLDSSMSLPFSDDFWSTSTSSSDLWPMLHDELIHKATDVLNHSDLSNFLEFKAREEHQAPSTQPTSSARASPDLSRSCTPNGSPMPSLSPLGLSKPESLSTSPDFSSCSVSSFVGKETAANTHRRGSGDSGSEKKEQQKLPRHKRPSHIRAETKRRGKIQVEF